MPAFQRWLIYRLLYPATSGVAGGTAPWLIVYMELSLPRSAMLGRWWFRYRSLSPLPVLVLLILMRPDFDMTLPLFLAGFVGVIGAESLRLWAVNHAGSSTRTRRDEAACLTTGGPYRWTRNPLYVANIGLYASFCFLFGHLWLTAVAFAYFAFQYSQIVRYEEALLEQLLGESYREYRHRVPRWVFGPRNATRNTDGSDTARGHRWIDAFRSERSTLVAISAMWLLWITRFLWRT